MASNMAKTAIKRSTGLTGLAVSPKPHHTLSVLYGKILRVLQKMPNDSSYKQATEEIINQRYSHVNNEQDVSKLEKLIGCGIAEELIVQAENELLLARNMLEWKPWEPLIKEPPKNQWEWPIN